VKRNLQPAKLFQNSIFAFFPFQIFIYFGYEIYNYVFLPFLFCFSSTQKDISIKNIFLFLNDFAVFRGIISMGFFFGEYWGVGPLLVKRGFLIDFG
jgi:hypothetical protein